MTASRDAAQQSLAAANAAIKTPSWTPARSERLSR